MKIWLAEDLGLTQGVRMKRDKIEVERSHKDQQWRWRYIASNGRIMADSAEGYHNRSACIEACMQVCNIDSFQTETHEKRTQVNEYTGTVQQGYMFRNSDEDAAFDLSVFW